MYLPSAFASTDPASLDALIAADPFVTLITVIDEKSIGDGKPGPVARRLREIYLDHARRTAI